MATIARRHARRADWDSVNRPGKTNLTSCPQMLVYRPGYVWKSPGLFRSVRTEPGGESKPRPFHSDLGS